MGTRSLTVFQEGDGGKEIAVMYRQFDGYPEGHGLDLCNFLKDCIVVNGIPCGMKLEEGQFVANGMGCLTAYVVGYFKFDCGTPEDIRKLNRRAPGLDTAGNIYLYPAETRDCWEEYVYYVTLKKTKTGPGIGSLHVRVVTVHGGYEDTPRTEKNIWNGSIAGFVKKYSKEVSDG